MIKLLKKEEYPDVIDYLRKDTITNYFIITSLERLPDEDMYENIWIEHNERNEISAVMCKRKTGNMQFYSDREFDAEKFCGILTDTGFIKLIGREDILKKLSDCYNFSGKINGSYISKLEVNTPIHTDDWKLNIEKMKVEDIDGIISLYKSVFSGFATKQSMVKKLKDDTGRGYYIKMKDEIISAAQSSYEDENSAVIIGVATHPQYRRKGYASKCLARLCSELTCEGKDLYLQYDNIEAGKIYKRFGFVDIGRMVSYFK